mmetsp:Transcript_91434/g.209523  ORF Transcript_91434/g.209523 Transcript_91434/m.209523 type:complete len:226 (-) Transcript_91434:2161-2838(-)
MGGRGGSQRRKLERQSVGFTMPRQLQLRVDRCGSYRHSCYLSQNPSHLDIPSPRPILGDGRHSTACIKRKTMTPSLWSYQYHTPIGSQLGLLLFDLFLQTVPEVARYITNNSGGGHRSLHISLSDVKLNKVRHCSTTIRKRNKKPYDDLPTPGHRRHHLIGVAVVHPGQKTILIFPSGTLQRVQQSQDHLGSLQSQHGFVDVRDACCDHRGLRALFPRQSLRCLP